MCIPYQSGPRKFTISTQNLCVYGVECCQLSYLVEGYCPKDSNQNQVRNERAEFRCTRFHPQRHSRGSEIFQLGNGDDREGNQRANWRQYSRKRSISSRHLRTTIAVGLASCLWLLWNVPYLVMASGHEPPYYIHESYDIDNIVLPWM